MGSTLTGLPSKLALVQNLPLESPAQHSRFSPSFSSLSLFFSLFLYQRHMKLFAHATRKGEKPPGGPAPNQERSRSGIKPSHYAQRWSTHLFNKFSGTSEDG